MMTGPLMAVRPLDANSVGGRALLREIGCMRQTQGTH